MYIVVGVWGREWNRRIEVLGDEFQVFFLLFADNRILLFSFSLLLLDEEPLSFDDFEGDFAGELDLFGVEFPLVDGELVRGFLAGLVEEDLEELFDGVEAFFLPLDSSSALDLLLALACEDRLDPPDLFLEEEEFLDDLEVAAISGYLEFNGSINSSFSRTTAQNGMMSEGMQRRVDWQWLWGCLMDERDCKIVAKKILGSKQ